MQDTRKRLAPTKEPQMNKPAFLSDDNRVLTEAEAAKALNISVATLRRMRTAGIGPPRTQLSSRRYGYLSHVLREHLARNTENHTA